MLATVGIEIPALRLFTMTFNLLLMAADKKVEMNVDAYCRAVRRVNSNFGITDLRACCSQWRIGTVRLTHSPSIKK